MRTFLQFVVLSAVLPGSLAAQDWKHDLQGTWTNGFATPLERPKQFADKPFFTADEAAAFEKAVSERPDPDAPVADPVVWWERGTKVVNTRRTSMVYDPPDGRIPALTPRHRKGWLTRAPKRANTRIAGRRIAA